MSTAFAEWTRVWSVRSSWILAGLTTLAVLGIGSLVGHDASQDLSQVTPGSTAWDGVDPTMMFALFGVLALATLTTTADDATGAIVPTLQWTPRRGVLLVARVATVAGTVTALGVVVVTTAGLVVHAFAPELPLGGAGGFEVAGRTAYLLGTSSLLACGLGLLLRSTAGTLVTVIGLVLVLPLLFAQLGYSWSTAISEHLPGSSALFLVFGEGPAEDMTSTSARLTLACWALGACAAGAWRLLRTDANR